MVNTGFCGIKTEITYILHLMWSASRARKRSSQIGPSFTHSLGSGISTHRVSGRSSHKKRSEIMVLSGTKGSHLPMQVARGLRLIASPYGRQTKYRRQSNRSRWRATHIQQAPPNVRRASGGGGSDGSKETENAQCVCDPSLEEILWV